MKIEENKNFLTVFKDSNGSLRAYILFYTLIWSSTILSHLNFIFVRIPILNLFEDSYRTILMLALLFGGINKIAKGISIKSVLITFFVILFYLLSSLIYVNSETFVEDNALNFALNVAPMLLVGCAMDWKFLRPIFIDVSRFTIIFTAFYYLYYAQRVLSPEAIEVDAEHMVASYELLPHVLLLIWNYFETKKKKDLLFLFIGILLIMSFGTRGPLVCMIVFVVSYLFFFKEYKSKYLVRILLLSAGVTLYLFTEEIALFMSEFTANIGLSSRIWDKYLEGELISFEGSSGRDYVYSKVFNELISGNWLFGYGIGQDRVLNDGLYVHNIILELLYSFGFLGGTCFILLILFPIVSIFLKNFSMDIKAFVLVMFCSFFIELLFSGSFITSSGLFLMVGFCYQQLWSYNK